MHANLLRLAGCPASILLGLAITVRADSPGTAPLQLTPTSAPATQQAPPANRYYSSSPYRYSNEPGPNFGPAPVAPVSRQFDSGDFELSLGGMGFVTRAHNRDDSIGFIAFDAGWYFVPTLSVDLELGIAPGTFDNNHRHHHDGGDDNGVRAVEEMVMLRWHFLTVGALSLYTDAGVGDLYATPAYPTGGRHDNFLLAAGGGLTVQVASHCYFGIGARAAWLDGARWDDGRHHDHWSDGLQYYGDFTFIFP